MNDLGKLLVLAGAIAIVAGLALILLGRANVPLGRLPGDIVYRGKNSTFYFPLATSIVLSVVLSVVMYLIGRCGVVISIQQSALSGSGRARLKSCRSVLGIGSASAAAVGLRCLPASLFCG